MKQSCLTMRAKGGKLFLKFKGTKNCKKKKEMAQDIINSLPTRKIIIK